MTPQNEPQKRENGYRRSREDAEQLFHDNMKLVPFVVNNMAISVTEDTYQDGYIGLWKAALLFDDTRGARFPTFAVRVIRHSIIMGWRATTRTATGDISLDQPFLFDYNGDGEVSYADALVDPRSEMETNDALLDIYLTDRLTKREKEITVMRMYGWPKTGIGKAFGHTDSWVNDQIKNIRRKLKNDFETKG